MNNDNRLNNQISKNKYSEMAGVPGFEPGRGGIKTRCLTAWLYPNKG